MKHLPLTSRSSALLAIMLSACLLGGALTLLPGPSVSLADISCGSDVALVAIKLKANQAACSFFKVSLRKSDLHDADLTRIILAESDLTRADLHNANLTGANLMGSFFNHANMEKANLTGANLSWGQFWSANLKEANLRGADLSRAELRRADLRYADLRGARLDMAVLAVADLRGADLRGAKLEGADFIKAKYDDATQWPERFNPASTTADKVD